MFSGLCKGFLNPSSMTSQKISQGVKGKAVCDFQKETEVRSQWEDHIEMACLDPMDIELLKSSLDKPTWFDTEDCRNTFKAFRENFDNSPGCQNCDSITHQLEDFNRQLLFPVANHEVVEASSSQCSYTDSKLKSYANPDQHQKIIYSRKELITIQQHSGPPLQPLANLDFLGLAFHSPQGKKGNHPLRRRRPRSSRKKLIYHKDFLLFDRSKACSLSSGQKFEIYHPYSCSVITLCLQHNTPNVPLSSPNQLSKVQSTFEAASYMNQDVEYESSTYTTSTADDPEISIVANDEFLVGNSSKEVFSQVEATCTSVMEAEDTCTIMREDEDSYTSEVEDGQTQQVDGTRVYGLIGLGFSKSGLGFAAHWASKIERNRSGNGSTEGTEPSHRKRLRVATYDLWVGRYPIKRRCVFSTYLSFPSCRISAAPPEDALSWVE